MWRRSWRGLVLIMGGLLTAAFSDAPAERAAPIGAAGPWMLAGLGDGEPGCAVQLGRGPVIGGAEIDVSATCRRNYDLEDVAGWRTRRGAIIFIGPQREDVAVFEPAPDGAGYLGTLPDGTRVSLMREPAPRTQPIATLVRTEKTFSLSGPGRRAACGFVLDVGWTHGGELRQVGRCPPRWRALSLRRWRASGETLQLLDAAARPRLTLRRADAETFVHEVDAAEPLFFGPGVIEAY